MKTLIKTLMKVGKKFHELKAFRNAPERIGKRIGKKF